MPIVLKTNHHSPRLRTGRVFRALTGLGGGSIVVPLLVLGSALTFAMQSALSYMHHRHFIRSRRAFVRDGYSNVRIGMLLEIATTIGALSGAYISGYVRFHSRRLSGLCSYSWR